MKDNIDYIEIDLPVSGVRAIVTKRGSSHQEKHYSAFNLASHVGDDSMRVATNRRRLDAHFAFAHSPLWLQQTHSTQVDWIRASTQAVSEQSDACFTTLHNTPCAILTADCLPILCADKHGKWVGAIHAGWRGLANGIIEKAFSSSSIQPQDVIAWIGPSICPDCFEIGVEVKHALGGEERHYRPSKNQNKLLANLPALAQQRMYAIGIAHCEISAWCSFEQNEDFYSYRREQITGRTASLIWME